jgi:AraC-like DNA-binding protein
MTVKYAHVTGEPLLFKPGLPSRFNGPLLPGVETYYSNSLVCDLVLQEHHTDFFNFRNVHVRWKRPGSIICRYSYDPSLFSRATISDNVLEYLKGAGKIHLQTAAFSILTGSKWTGLLAADRSCEHHFVDIAWSAEMLENMHAEYPDVHYTLQNITDGLPDRLKVPYHPLDTYMQKLITDVFQLDFAEATATGIFQDLIERYLNMILREAKQCKEIRKKIGEDDWQIILKAQSLIDENADRHFTIPEISSVVGMNNYKLKKLFPIATGFTIDEYRKYWLCANAAKKIVQTPELPLKNFFSEAGYTSESTFVRGFKKLCCCTPGELRGEGWHVGKINY